MTELLRNNWIFLKPPGWPKLKKRINKLHEKTAMFAKVESDKLTSTNNSRNLPSNATIREEYVMCGKWDCSCEHGPLTTHIGKMIMENYTKSISVNILHQIEKTNKHKSSRNYSGPSSPMDTPTDASNNPERDLKIT